MPLDGMPRSSSRVVVPAVMPSNGEWTVGVLRLRTDHEVFRFGVARSPRLVSGDGPLAHMDRQVLIEQACEILCELDPDVMITFLTASPAIRTM
jgi:hypothetical protein